MVLITHEQRQRMILKAKDRHGDDISPCHNCTWETSINEMRPGELWLWYNDRQHSTHIIRETAPKKPFLTQ